MQDLCHATRYIRTISNPMRGIIIKFFHILIFWGCIFSCAFLFFVLFLFCVCVFFCNVFIVVLFLCVFFVDIFSIFNLNFSRNRQTIITMKFQDAS